MSIPNIPADARKMRSGRFVRGYHFDQYKVGRYDTAFQSEPLNAIVRSNPNKSTFSAWLGEVIVGTRFQTATRAMVACIEKSAK